MIMAKSCLRPAACWRRVDMLAFCSSSIFCMRLCRSFCGPKYKHRYHVLISQLCYLVRVMPAVAWAEQGIRSRRGPCLRTQRLRGRRWLVWNSETVCAAFVQCHSESTRLSNHDSNESSFSRARGQGRYRGAAAGAPDQLRRKRPVGRLAGRLVSKTRTVEKKCFTSIILV